MRGWLIYSLNGHALADCGLTGIRVLEFDHRGGEMRRAAVAVLARGGDSLATVQEKVATYLVRWADCHRIRAQEQRNWWGATRRGE